MKPSIQNKKNLTLLDIDLIGKKLGKLEVATSHLQEQITNDNIHKIYVDSKASELNSNFQNEILLLKQGFDQLAALVSESFEDIKSNLTEDIDFKTTNLSKLIETSLERLDGIEQTISEQTIDQSSKDQTISNQLHSFNNHLNNELKHFASELNTAMVKISFIEKQLNEHSASFNNKLGVMSKDIKEIKKVLDSLLMYKEVSSKNIEHLQCDHATSQEINCKFNQQTTMLIEEVKGKMKRYDNSMKDYIENFDKIKKDVCGEVSEMKGKLNGDMNLIHVQIDEEMKKMKDEINAFQLKINEENDDMTKYIHGEINGISMEIKSFFDDYSGKVNQLKNKEEELEEKVMNNQKDLFDNLNEIEEYMNKKYDSVMRIMNNQRNFTHETTTYA